MAPKKAAKRTAAPPEAPLSFDILPSPAKVAVAQGLLRFNKLDTVTTVCENIANLSCTCREMRDICRELWPQVAAAIEPGPSDGPVPWWDGAPPSKRIEKTGVSIDYTYDGPFPLLPEEVKAEVASGEFEGSLVPPRIAAEMMRLNTRYLAETRACKEYGLTPGDLQDVATMAEVEEVSGWRLRRLPDVARVAQRKYGTFEALEAWRRASESKEKQVERWLIDHTTYDALLQRATFGEYVSNKDKKTAKQKALVAWVRGEHRGDVDVAVHSPAVTSAPQKAQRSIVASIPPALPWSQWPPTAKIALAESLVCKWNRLDNVTNVSKNIANLACTCREMRDICRTMWPTVAAAVEPEAGDPALPWWEGAPSRKRLKNTQFLFDPTYHGLYPLTTQEVKTEVKHGEFEGSPVPPRVAAEMMRLASRYVPESRACKEYALNPKDLEAIEEITVGQPGQGLGYMHLRRLSDVAAVAQRKDGNFEALEELLAAEKAKESERSAADAKKRVGVEGWLSEHTCYDALVAQEAYANSKRRKVLKTQALVDWVQNEWAGEVDAAARSPAVKSAPKESQRSIAASIRAAWKAKGAGGGGGRGGAGGSGSGGLVEYFDPDYLDFLNEAS